MADDRVVLDSARLIALADSIQVSVSKQRSLTRCRPLLSRQFLLIVRRFGNEGHLSRGLRASGWALRTVLQQADRQLVFQAIVPDGFDVVVTHHPVGCVCRKCHDEQCRRGSAECRLRAKTASKECVHLQIPSHRRAVGIVASVRRPLGLKRQCARAGHLNFRWTCSAAPRHATRSSSTPGTQSRPPATPNPPRRVRQAGRPCRERQVPGSTPRPPAARRR